MKPSDSFFNRNFSETSTSHTIIEIEIRYGGNVIKIRKRERHASLKFYWVDVINEKMIKFKILNVSFLNITYVL